MQRKDGFDDLKRAASRREQPAVRAHLRVGRRRRARDVHSRRGRRRWSVTLERTSYYACVVNELQRDDVFDDALAALLARTAQTRHLVSEEASEERVKADVGRCGGKGKQTWRVEGAACDQSDGAVGVRDLIGRASMQQAECRTATPLRHRLYGAMEQFVEACPSTTPTHAAAPVPKMRRATRQCAIPSVSATRRATVAPRAKPPRALCT
jgi:hypothetical protein